MTSGLLILLIQTILLMDFAVVPICLHPLPFNILLLTLLHRRNYCMYVSNIEQKWVHYLKEQWRNNDVISSVDEQQSAE